MENNFIDVHCHIEMVEIPAHKVIENAKSAGVGIIVTQGVNKESNRKSLAFSEKYDIVESALGLYPIDALKMTEEDIDKEINFIRENKEKIVAVGEVGLDFKENDEKEKQREIFEKMVKLAIEIDRPLIVHSRKAEAECIEILEKLCAKKVIMHCFSGKLSLVKRIIENKWYMTIPTSVVRSEHFQKVIEMTPIEQLFCETDSPYLSPDKIWPNEPSKVLSSYSKIAELKKMAVEDVALFLVKNYINLFQYSFQ